MCIKLCFSGLDWQYLLQAALWYTHFNYRQPSPSIGLSPPSVGSSSGNKRAEASSPTAAKRKQKSSTSKRSISAISEILRSGHGSGVKDTRYPERLIKRLNERLGTVAMGQDPAYRDPVLRGTIASFYGKFSEKEFQRSLKENRSLEDLVLQFTTHAHNHLNSQSQIASQPIQMSDVKEQLDHQVLQFVRIVRDTVASMRLGARDLLTSSHKDLVARLDAYIDNLEGPGKLIPYPPNTPVASPATGGSLASASSAQLAGPGAGPTPPLGALDMPASDLVEEQSSFRTIARLMGVNHAQLLADIDTVRSACTDKAIYADLKHMVANVNKEDVWPGCRPQFDNEETWKVRKAEELDGLSQQIATLCSINPELPNNPASADAPSSVADELSQDLAAYISPTPASSPTNYTFLPPDPMQLLPHVMRICFEADLKAISTSADDDGVELTILSAAHVELLEQVVDVWRIREPLARLTHLMLVLEQMEKRDGPISIPISCLEAVLTRVEAEMEERPPASWMSQEKELLEGSCLRALSCVLYQMASLLQDLQGTDNDELRSWSNLAQHIHATLLHRSFRSRQLLEPHLNDLKDLIHVQAIHDYTTHSTEILGNSEQNAAVCLHELYTWLHKRARKTSKQFSGALLDDTLKIPLLVLEKQVPLFWDDMTRLKPAVMDQALREEEGIPFNDVFELYRDVQDLERLFKSTCPYFTWDFDVAEWFQPHVEHWLVHMSDKTFEWVDNAIRVDTFAPIDSVNAFHSSSIDDLFSALQQPLDFLESLDWPDPVGLACFKTSLARTFSLAIEQYCNRIKDMFMNEISTRTNSGPTQDGVQKQHQAWMNRTKMTLRGEEKIEPFALQKATCIKLNNIEKARQLLDSLYTKMDAEVQSRILTEHRLRSSEPIGSSPNGNLKSLSTKQDPSATHGEMRHTFTVKVVQASGLRALSGIMSSHLDSFVTLKDESTRTIFARTRTMFETCDPQWDESFDITIIEPIWLTLSVYERRMISSDSSCGKTAIKLDPALFQDFKSHDLVLELDTRGKLHVRVSVEEEQEEILFHFGRAFRSLKRCESDMVRTIVDKITIFIRYILSRSTVKSLVKTNKVGKSLGMVKDFASSAWASAAISANKSESLIPPVRAGPVRLRSKDAELSDAEIENAIAPLFDYFDSVLSTLDANLSPDERMTVLSKVWKQVLITLQSILMPPLSDQSSDMRPLTDLQTGVVMKWRLFLFTYFLARDESTNEVHGLPVEVLQTTKFRELDEFVVLNDLSTDQLMLECSRSMQRSLQKQTGGQGQHQPKSVLNQRSLGTIKKRKTEKKESQDDFSNEEVILRILRYVQHLSSTLKVLVFVQGSSPLDGTYS